MTMTKVDDLKNLPEKDLELATKFAKAVWAGEFGIEDPENSGLEGTSVHGIMIAKAHDILRSAKKLGFKIKL
jgi:hypothetical protein